jgi:hypothetical protein
VIGWSLAARVGYTLYEILYFMLPLLAHTAIVTLTNCNREKRKLQRNS